VIGIDPTEFLPQSRPGYMFVVVALALSVLAIVNFILLMTWLFKATRFIGGKTNPALTISPGWAIGWWFIPIANFIAPFMVMTELYNASRTPENWNKRGLPILAILWWGATWLSIAVALRPAAPGPDVRQYLWARNAPATEPACPGDGHHALSK